MTTRRRDLLRGVAPAAIAILGGGLLGACRTASVYSPDNTNFAGRGNFAERGRIIRTAASTQGWTTQYAGPGRIRATRTDGSHLVTVDITYDVRSFSVRRVNSSPNLRFDGTNIHVLYNEWVRGLESAIVTQSA